MRHGANRGQRAVETINRLRELRHGWNAMSFLEMSVETLDGHLHFRVVIDFGTVPQQSVLVELYASVSRWPPCRQIMTQDDRATKGKNISVYSSQVPSARPAADYTPRIIPNLPGVAIPLELDLILWQR